MLKIIGLIMDGQKREQRKMQQIARLLSLMIMMTTAFWTLSAQVPSLLRGLRNVLYSKDAAENMADAVATFYTKLVAAGIPKDEAMDMTKGYMINLRDLFGGEGGLNVNVTKPDSSGSDD